PRTKRKYTVSDKVRAANHLNLEKARAVDKKIRYRPTDKRLDASRANLLKARQSPNYKPYVKNGLRAVDLRRSAPQVGETQEEYDRHLELVERVLPANRQRLRNGVRGLAQALWRRRRVFVSRVQRETFSFYLELEKAAVWGLCPASVQGLGWVTTDVFLEGEHPRLEEMMDSLDKRLVRVAEAYLTEHTEDLVHLEVWGNHCFRADFLDQPPEVIGNGLVRPGQVKRRMKKQPKGDLKPTGLWPWVLKVARTKSGLLKEWIRLGYRLPDPRREEDFGLHLRLIEAAFFGDRQEGFGLAGSGGGAAAGEGHGEAEMPALTGLDLCVAKFKAAQPELYRAVRNWAEATWERLRVFARQAEQEAQELREKLERAARGTLGPGQKSLKDLWREARDRRLDQLPRNPIDEALWAGFQL
ncbi:MAG TPA: hypothetical protein VN648_08460, partial [Candidatus Methylomirabilis sp.]|nr:hypothetical protein [Candidatus Methylomirabilis sp.]